MVSHVRGVGRCPTNRAAKPQLTLQHFLSSPLSLHHIHWPSVLQEMVGRVVVLWKSICWVLSPRQWEITHSAAEKAELLKVPLSEQINITSVKYPTAAVEMVACNITQCEPLSRFQPQLPLFWNFIFNYRILNQSCWSWNKMSWWLAGISHTFLLFSASEQMLRIA